MKLTVPKALYMALVKLQASEDLDFDQALIRAAELLDSNGKAFKKAVENHAQSLYKSRLMREINKARESIEESAYERGANYARRNEDNFRVPCPKCGKDMQISSRDANWDQSKAQLYGAFSNWNHTKCP